MPFIELAQLAEREPVRGYRARFVHSNNVTLAYWTITAGAELPEHAHPHEQIATVLEGRFELTISGETQNLGPGGVAVIPSNTVHSGRALTDCRIQDVFYPIREDYR